MTTHTPTTETTPQPAEQPGEQTTASASANANASTHVDTDADTGDTKTAADSRPTNSAKAPSDADLSSVLWIRTHYRLLRDLPSEADEPFCAADLPEQVRERLQALISHDVITPYDDGGPYDPDDPPEFVQEHINGDTLSERNCRSLHEKGYILNHTNTKKFFWQVPPEARREIKQAGANRQAGKTQNGSSSNPLPCGDDSCPVAAFQTYSDVIYCKDCGTAYRRDTLEPVTDIDPDELGDAPRCDGNGGDDA